MQLASGSFRKETSFEKRSECPHARTVPRRGANQLRGGDPLSQCLFSNKIDNRHCESIETADSQELGRFLFSSLLQMQTLSQLGDTGGDERKVAFEVGPVF